MHGIDWALSFYYGIELPSDYRTKVKCAFVKFLSTSVLQSQVKSSWNESRYYVSCDLMDLEHSRLESLDFGTGCLMVWARTDQIRECAFQQGVHSENTDQWTNRIYKVPARYDRIVDRSITYDRTVGFRTTYDRFMHDRSKGNITIEFIASYWHPSNSLNAHW